MWRTVMDNETTTVKRAAKIMLSALATCGLLLGLGLGCSATNDNATASGAGGSDTVGVGGGGGGGGGEAGQGGVVNTVTVGSGGAQSGCEKVDFLFVVDNSVSMADQQAALIASFPNFISTIQNTLSATSDYHIMVVDTDAETRCTAEGCANPDTFAQQLCTQPVAGYACNTMFEACDTTLGAGVVHPAGKGASNKPCDVFGGNRYAVEGDPDLASTFGCLAMVGLAGHPTERPMDAMVAALAAPINDAAGCNQGFLRDDAILVITFMSDDPFYEDSGTPQDWYDAVVAAKKGNKDAVAVLGFTPNFAGCGPPKSMDKGKHWSEFVALWGDRGLEVSVCEPDFAPYFTESVKIIDEACDNFEPK
jgi:hypothetical protein